MSGRGRARVRWGAAVGAVAVCGAAVVVHPSSRTTVEPQPSSPAVSTLQPPVRLTTVAEFCAAYSSFLVASEDQVADPGRADTTRLEAAGVTLETMGRPPRMTEVVATGLTQYVEDTLLPFRQREGAPATRSTTRSAADQDAVEAFRAYVGRTCPPS